jgi:hypothetical protein
LIQINNQVKRPYFGTWAVCGHGKARRNWNWGTERVAIEPQHKIGKIPYSQVYPNLIITDIKENTGNITGFFSGKSNTYYATLTACTTANTHTLF